MTSSPSSSFVVQVGTLPNFSDQWRSINSNRFVLNMVKGHQLQLRCHPLLLCSFKWFIIKAAMSHHAIIQMEMNELVAKEVIEQSTSGAGFYSNLLLVLSILVVYNPYSTLSNSIAIYMYLLLRCLLPDRYNNLFNKAIMFFSIDLKDAYLHIPINKHYHHFYILFGNKNHTSAGFCHLGCLWLLRFSFHLLNPYCSLLTQGFSCYYICG